MRRVQIGAIVALIFIGAYGWIAAASAIYCWGRGILDLYTFPWVQWAVAVPWFNFDDSVRFWLILGAIPPSGLLALLALVWVSNRSRPAPKVYGETGWANRTDMAGGGITSTQRPL
jgi:hypothetical protein